MHPKKLKAQENLKKNHFLKKKLTKNLHSSKIGCNFASLFEKARVLSSAGSEHLPYKQRVGGSNPSAPTQQLGRRKSPFFCILIPQFI